MAEMAERFKSTIEGYAAQLQPKMDRAEANNDMDEGVLVSIEALSVASHLQNGFIYWLLQQVEELTERVEALSAPAEEENDVGDE